MAGPTSFDHDDDRAIWDAPMPTGGWGSTNANGPCAHPVVG